MSTNRKRINWSAVISNNNRNTALLRIGVVFLSAVSFFTTANGMRAYIFTDNDGIAYAASAAIQGILLALSMNLPGYLRDICKKQGENREDEEVWKLALRKVGRFCWKSLVCICAVTLTCVTIFCSSWFSYIYIADILHRNSWDIDSELLVQQTYRSQLYAAQDYAKSYRSYLEESIGDDLVLLETQATGLPNFSAGLTINWEEETATYVPNDGSTASGYMSNVIEAMKAAMPQDASQEAKELAITAVADAQTNISSRMESIQQNQSTIDNNINMYNNQITAWRNQLNRETSETNRQSLTNLIAQYTGLMTDASQRQAELQTEYLKLESALQRLPFYESLLGLSSSTSAVSIQSDLIQLQSEFFQQEPDEEKLMSTASLIFEKLRSASRVSAGGGTDDPENSDTPSNQGTPGSSDANNNDLSYMVLMRQMNRLIQNLTDYADMKDTEANLGELIDDLRRIEASIAAVPAPDKEQAPDSQWKEEWRSRVANLKAQIGAMPTYQNEGTSTAESGENGIGNGASDTGSGILTEPAVSILNNYDRDSSCRELDDITRRYLSDHNAVYNGLIYLQSSYSSLAIFALILALSFDLSGFIFGFIAQGTTEEKDATKVKDQWPEPAGFLMHNAAGGQQMHTPTIEQDQVEWTILKTLNPYIILTGDFEVRDSVYYYKAFKDGQLYEWAVKDTAPYPKGIYIQNAPKDMWASGKSLPKEGQRLLFAQQEDGPVDGIYMDCRLAFHNGSLLLLRAGESEFVAGIDEYVPVHSYLPERGESCTVPAEELAKQQLNAKIAVVALNDEGTRIAAIYAFGHEQGD